MSKNTESIDMTEDNFWLFERIYIYLEIGSQVLVTFYWLKIDLIQEEII